MKCGALALLIAGSCFAQTARDYYKELYAAGGLDQVLSEHVCFDERTDLKTFFIFTSSKVIREVMMVDGSWAKASKSLQAELNKELLIFRGYDKGVPISTEDDMHPDNNGGWLSDSFVLDKHPAHVRFTISWETLRYKRSVEGIDADGTSRPIISTYGRCELVSHAIRQHGR